MFPSIVPQIAPKIKCYRRVDKNKTLCYNKKDSGYPESEATTNGRRLSLALERGRCLMEYITLILIIVFYTILAIKKK